MNWPSLATVNAFIEDTCVLLVIAYSLGRSPLLGLLFDSKGRGSRIWLLIALCGLIASTEAVFPNSRAPYVTSTLMIALAFVLGGPAVAGGSGAVAALAFLTFGHIGTTLSTLAATAGIVLLGVASGRVGKWNLFVWSAVLAAVGQGIAVGVCALQHAHTREGTPSIAANAFGIVLILLVLQDARIRAQSVANELEVHRMRGLLTEAQLQDLRSRVQPHFMFNALTSIAALCRIDPKKAERAIVSLGQLMRTTLDTPATQQVPIYVEIERVKSYLEIEQMRLASRICLDWQIDENALTECIPAFALQTIVENAVIHGISKVSKPVLLTIRIHRVGSRVGILVRDTGQGFASPPVLSAERPSHGLPLTNQRLIRLCGPRARLRIFSAPSKGALVAFSIPRS